MIKCLLNRESIFWSISANNVVHEWSKKRVLSRKRSLVHVTTIRKILSPVSAINAYRGYIRKGIKICYMYILEEIFTNNFFAGCKKCKVSFPLCWWLEMSPSWSLLAVHPKILRGDGVSNPTRCSQICLNPLHSQVVGHSVKLSLPDFMKRGQFLRNILLKYKIF